MEPNFPRQSPNLKDYAYEQNRVQKLVRFPVIGSGEFKPTINLEHSMLSEDALLP